MRIPFVIFAVAAIAVACAKSESAGGPVLCAGAGGTPATYSAVSGFAGVTLSASIDLPRPGYTVSLEMQPQKPLPRTYGLMCTAPQGVGAEKITRYETSIAVEGGQVGDEVEVRDAQGSHKIRIIGPGSGAAAMAATSASTTAGPACGGIAGIACGGKQYCAKEAGTCQVADSAGVCKVKPEVCTEQFSPVCGCDGKTYSNACMAAAAGMNVERAGECGKGAGK